VNFCVKLLPVCVGGLIVLGGRAAYAATPTSTPAPAATLTPSPQQLATFQGSAWVNAHASSGPIVAKISDAVCSEPSVAGLGPDSNTPLYTVRVLSDDMRPGCGREGAVLNFFVEDQPASQTAIWHAASTQFLNLIAGPPFARFGGKLSIRRTSSGESVVPIIGDRLCGYDMTGGILGSVSLYDAIVYSAQQQPGCGVEGAEITFNLLDAEGNVIAVAKEEGVWRAWDGISPSQQLNLTMVPVGGITIPSVGTGDARQHGSGPWGTLAAVLSGAGLIGIATAAALRKRTATR